MSDAVLRVVTSSDAITGCALLRAAHVCFSAPELDSDSGHDCACDIWSLGALMHLCLLGTLPGGVIYSVHPEAGAPPLGARSAPERLPVEALQGQVAKLSEGVRSILQAMLFSDKSRRISAADILLHPFWENGADLALTVAQERLELLL